MTAEIVHDDLLPEAIDEAFTPRMRPSVAWVTLDDDTVLLDGETWVSHMIDRAGTLLLDFFDGQTPLSQTVAELTEAFQADPDVIRADVLAFARQLGEVGLLEGVSPPPPVLPDLGVEVGTPIVEFTATTLEGEQVTMTDLLGRRVLLVNWHPGCIFCRTIAGTLAEAEDGLRRNGIEMLFLSGGSEPENRALVDEAGITSRIALGDAGPKVFAGLGTPAAYLLDDAGRTAEPLAMGAGMVPDLVSRLAVTE